MYFHEKYPDVKVEEITDETMLKKFIANLAPNVDLQDNMLNDRVNGLIQQMRSKSKRRFLLAWTGGNIPRGARILEYEIGWTQHDLVTAIGGEIIGTYDRLIENGGETKKEQVMIVYFDPDNAF
ncbi:MAG: hypothetical protein WC788_07715 [Candidatus Paceibacterota bacterium]